MRLRLWTRHGEKSGTRLRSKVPLWQTPSATRLRYAIQSNPIHRILPFFDSLLGILFIPIVPPSATVLFINKLATTPPIWRVTWKLVELCFYEEDNAFNHPSLGWYERYNFGISSCSPATQILLCYLTDCNISQSKSCGNSLL
jgi:hypothetical protein